MIERVDVRSFFARPKPLIGMVHLLPLPGAPRWRGSMQEVLDRAVSDADRIAAGGLDGIMIENYGDLPFTADHVEPETVAAMAVTAAAIAREVTLPFGINVLRNDAAAAIALAAATGARFIRVNVHTGAMLTDQGWITGRADATLRRRRTLGVPSAICADVLVKHAIPPAGANAASAARDTWERGLADVLIVSGSATGAETDIERLRVIRTSMPDAPLWIGSGLTAANAAAQLAIADGAIVGSAIQMDGRAGNAIDRERVRRIADAAH